MVCLKSFQSFRASCWHAAELATVVSSQFQPKVAVVNLICLVCYASGLGFMIERELSLLDGWDVCLHGRNVLDR
jgi:hypothetical protein